MTLEFLGDEEQARLDALPEDLRAQVASLMVDMNRARPDLNQPGMFGDWFDAIEKRFVGREPCPARVYHGPGHQSSTRCHRLGSHVTHEAIYGGDRQTARWRDGDYTNSLRAQGIDFDPKSYPENMGMTGFFDEPPQEVE